MTSPDHIVSVFKDYCAAWKKGDLDALVYLFAKDAIVEDPVGSPKIEGHQALRKAWGDFLGKISFQLEGSVRVAGNVGAAAFTVKLPAMEPPVMLESIDVMHFDDNGKITSMQGIWSEFNSKPLTG